MKNYLAVAILAMSSTVYATDMVLPVRGVVDGDTIQTVLELPCPLCYASIRILGIDTPESNFLAKCSAEQVKGTAAKEFLKEYVGDATTMIVRNIKWDKYGGRINANVDINGVDIGKLMIEKGYARPYRGIGPKSDWCVDQKDK